MNYSKLSDSEINKRVALSSGKNIKFISVDVDDNDVGIIVGQKHTRQRLPFDPCNNPSDAWPIIVENKIDVIQDNGQECALATNSAIMMYQAEDVYIEQDVNPLRAAMIVFLMMQDAK